MPAIERTAAILLAAGRSLRFGSADKLMSDFEGRPMVDHAAETLAGLPFAHHIAVVRVGATELRDLLELRGFTIVENDRPEDGLSHSIALGVAAAGEAEAALIALGDMPRVPADHFRALCEAAGEGGAASLGLDRSTVPAAFIAARFAELATLTGDQGARTLLADAVPVRIDPAALLDVDR